MQDDHAPLFDLYPRRLARPFFAAHGDIVLAINYRGSGGRGAGGSARLTAKTRYPRPG